MTRKSLLLALAWPWRRSQAPNRSQPGTMSGPHRLADRGGRWGLHGRYGRGSRSSRLAWQGRRCPDRQRPAWQDRWPHHRPRAYRSPRASIGGVSPSARHVFPRDRGWVLDVSGQPVVFDRALIRTVSIKAQHNGGAMARKPAAPAAAETRMGPCARMVRTNVARRARRLGAAANTSSRAAAGRSTSSATRATRARRFSRARLAR